MHMLINGELRKPWAAPWQHNSMDMGYISSLKSLPLLGLLVLRRHTLERYNKVLKRTLLLATLGGFAVHEVVESSAVLEEVVDTAHDT